MSRKDFAHRHIGKILALSVWLLLAVLLMAPLPVFGETVPTGEEVTGNEAETSGAGPEDLLMTDVLEEEYTSVIDVPEYFPEPSASRSETVQSPVLFDGGQGEFTGLYGDQLDTRQRGFYDELEEVDHPETYTYVSGSSEKVWLKLQVVDGGLGTCTEEEFNNQTYRSLPSVQKLKGDLLKGYDAWLKDDPLNYWASGITYRFTYSYNRTTQALSCSQAEVSFQLYYAGILEECAEADAGIEAAVTEIRQQLSGSRDRLFTVRVIEQYLTDLIRYDSAAARSSDLTAYGYAHTVTGPLVAKYGQKGVCEAYAKLFKILCDRFQVPCVIVIGGASSSAKVDHMWNYVCMEDDVWYLVDTTWDDTGGSTQWQVTGTETGATADNHFVSGWFINLPNPYDPFFFPTLPGKAYFSQDVWDFVGRLYQIVLEREPDLTGPYDWHRQLVTRQKSGAQVSYGFIFSPEYLNRHTSDDEYLTMMYRTLLDREPDEAGFAYWSERLYLGCTRKLILQGFAGSTEFHRLCDDYGIDAGSYRSDDLLDQNQDVTMFVGRLYRICLERAAIDRAGQEGWVRALLNGMTGKQVTDSFFFSREFIQKNHSDEEFVTLAYRTVLDREPDEAGFAGWVNALASGQSRNQVLDGFTRSREFSQLCARYGIRAS